VYVQRVGELGFLLPLGGVTAAWLWLALSREPQPAARWYWLVGWLALLVSGVLGASDRGVIPFELSLVLSSAFGSFVLAGVYRYVGRGAPIWVLPLGVAVGSVRAFFYALGDEAPAALFTLFAEPSIVLGAAVVAWRGVYIDGLARRVLAPSCLALSAIEGFDAYQDILAGSSLIQWGLWLSTAAVLFPLHVVLIVRSLRDRATRIADALHDREEVLRTILASLRQTRVMFFDREARFRAIYGDPKQRTSSVPLPEAFEGRAAAELLDPQDRDRFRGAIERVFETEVPESLALSVRAYGNVTEWILELAPIHEADASVDVLLGVGKDVTEQAETLRELRRSEARLNALLSSVSQDQVVILDREYRVESIVGASNDSQLRGPARHEVEGESVAKFMQGEGLDRFKGAVRKVFETGRNQSLEERVEMPHGPMHFDLSLRPLRGEAGEVERVITVVTDVTKRIEEEQQRQLLERRVAQSQKLESLGILAGGIAHDFNNLLVGVLGNAEMALQGTSESDPRHEYLRDILRSSERATDLTSQLLAYAGKATLSMDTLRIQAPVEEMVGLLRASVGPETHLEMSTLEKDLWVRADATQLRQLVMNLVTNAIEALPGGAGHVWVRTGIEPGALDGVDAVLLEVQDDGTGMDEETRSRIFEPFFTTKFEGRGLGLAAVQGIVRGHHGAIRVESSSDKGTIIRVLLPRVTASAHEPTPSPISESTWSGRGRILVVDDDEGVRAVARRMLERIGFDVVVARGAEEALAQCQEGALAIDAILLDLTMPDVDGLTLGRRLRDLRPNAPVVFMSGHSEGESAARVDGPFLKKPFRSSELRRLLQIALS